MSKQFRIVRDGVPHYCAPWVADLSPKARAMIGTGPSRHDPQGQLGLPIPDPESEMPAQLSFVLPCKTRPSPARAKPDMESELAACLRNLLNEVLQTKKGLTITTPLAREQARAVLARVRS